jgi:hypothetical protein
VLRMTLLCMGKLVFIGLHTSGGQVPIGLQIGVARKSVGGGLLSSGPRVRAERERGAQSSGAATLLSRGSSRPRSRRQTATSMRTPIEWHPDSPATASRRNLDLRCVQVHLPPRQVQLRMPHQRDCWNNRVA